jgi:hypothetical protein
MRHRINVAVFHADVWGRGGREICCDIDHVYLDSYVLTHKFFNPENQLLCKWIWYLLCSAQEKSLMIRDVMYECLLHKYFPWMFTEDTVICKIWGFHGGDYDDYHLLGDDNHTVI